MARAGSPGGTLIRCSRAMRARALRRRESGEPGGATEVGRSEERGEMRRVGEDAVPEIGVREKRDAREELGGGPVRSSASG